MERYRYTGELASVDVPISGALIQFPRNKWVDPEKACDAALVPVEHLRIVLAGLSDEFEREGPVKAARTRKANASPAEPEQEEDQ